MHQFLTTSVFFVDSSSEVACLLWLPEVSVWLSTLPVAVAPPVVLWNSASAWSPSCRWQAQSVCNCILLNPTSMPNQWEGAGMTDFCSPCPLWNAHNDTQSPLGKLTHCNTSNCRRFVVLPSCYAQGMAQHTGQADLSHHSATCCSANVHLLGLIPVLLLGTGSLLTDLGHSLPLLLSLRRLLALEGLDLFLQQKRAGLSIPCNVTASRRPAKGRKRLHCLAAKLFSTQQCRQHYCASCKVNTESTMQTVDVLPTFSLMSACWSATRVLASLASFWRVARSR